MFNRAVLPPVAVVLIVSVRSLFAGEPRYIVRSAGFGPRT